MEERRRGNALSLSLYPADCTVNIDQCLCVRTVTQYSMLPFSYSTPTVGTIAGGVEFRFHCQDMT
jgi:hypothetical protein